MKLYRYNIKSKITSNITLIMLPELYRNVIGFTAKDCYPNYCCRLVHFLSAASRRQPRHSLSPNPDPCLHYFTVWEYKNAIKYELLLVNLLLMTPFRHKCCLGDVVVIKSVTCDDMCYTCLYLHFSVIALQLWLTGSPQFYTKCCNYIIWRLPITIT